MPGLDNSLQLAAKGYGFLPDRRRAQARRTVLARLMGMRATALEGPDAARFFYDEDHVRRSGAIPEPVQATLFGKGAVHTLDGEAHRVRKAMFVDLLMGEDGIASLVQRVTSAWDDAVQDWARRPGIVLFDEAGRVLAGAVCRWAGIPLTDDEVPAVARDLTAMVDAFATAGPRHWRARPASPLGPPRAPRRAPATGGRAGPVGAGRPGSRIWSSGSVAARFVCRRAPRSTSSRTTRTREGRPWTRGLPRSNCSTSSGRPSRSAGSWPSAGTR